MPSDRHDPGIAWYRRVPRWVTLLVAVGIGVGISFVVGNALSSTGRDVNAPYTVVYSVTGTVATADISWYEDAGAASSTSGFVDAHLLPWSKTTVVKGAFPTFTLTAMASTSNESGALTCKITVNGSVRSSQTLRGIEPSVACDDSETSS